MLKISFISALALATTSLFFNCQKPITEIVPEPPSIDTFTVTFNYPKKTVEILEVPNHSSNPRFTKLVTSYCLSKSDHVFTFWSGLDLDSSYMKPLVLQNAIKNWNIRTWNKPGQFQGSKVLSVYFDDSVTRENMIFTLKLCFNPVNSGYSDPK
jgi:hypothetical protein